MHIIEVHLTHQCNLNCASCTHYAPLYTGKYFKPIEEYMKEIAQLAALYQRSLYQIRLLGGEPLLHPDIISFCAATRYAFPYTSIEIVTNGILLPTMPQKFFDGLKKYDIGIYLSDYNLSPKIRECLQKSGVQFRCGERPTFIKPALNLRGDQDYKATFYDCKQCMSDECTQLRDGKLYHCPTEAYFDFFLNYFNIELKDFKWEDLGIDIFKSSVEEIEKYLKSPSQFCKYCDLIVKRTHDVEHHISKCQASEWLS